MKFSCLKPEGKMGQYGVSPTWLGRRGVAFLVLAGTTPALRSGISQLSGSLAVLAGPEAGLAVWVFLRVA